MKQRNTAGVRALLRQRVDVNVPEGDGATALHWAVYLDDIEIVDLLLAARANVNATNDLKVTPLALASRNGDAAIVEKLIKSGANPNISNEAAVTPLMEASRTGSVDSVRALVAAGANVNATATTRNQTALMWAVAERHPDVARVLLDRGADVSARTSTRSEEVLLERGPQGVIKTTREPHSEVERKVGTAMNFGGTTALLFAAQSGDVDSARLLLTAGANANDKASDGTSALVLATFTGHPALAGVLLEAGADPNVNDVGYSALHVAVLRSDVATVKALLAHGANVNARVTRGSPVRRYGAQWAIPNTLVGATPLFLAASYLESDIIRALLAGGAAPAIAISDGTTPLQAAAGIEVERDTRPQDPVADPDQATGTPTAARPEKHILEVVQLLLDSGTDINDPNQAGNTALHGAASNGFTSVIHLLVDRGAKLDIKNTKGQTPLALTIAGQKQGGRRAAGLKNAEELLRQLGATE